MALYLAIDLGTTGCRSILFDEKLTQLRDSYREYGLITPRENWVEQDANLWWTLTLETAKEVLQDADRTSVEGISISSQGITLVPVDGDLNPLHNGINWLDARAKEEAVQITEDFGTEYMFELTGKPIDPCYFLPKLLWIKKHLPEVYHKAWKFLMPMDYLTAKLTGKCLTDHSMASGTLLYDIRKHVWSREVLEKYEIAEEKLPRLAWSGEAAGPLLPEIAKELGLSENCMVAVGAQDQRCASLGAGLGMDTMTISLGTSGAICRYWDHVDTERSRKVGWSAYIDEKSWVTEGVINTAAVCLRWLRDEMFPGKSYDEIGKEAEAARERGSTVRCYPYFNGPSSPDYYPEAEGCFYGVNLASGRGDFALAVMEGIAYQIRILLEAMEASGHVRRLVLFGGGARSDLWCRIIADVTGMEIQVPVTSEAAGAGAAILAGIGTGAFTKDRLPALPVSRSCKPGEWQQAYEEKYRKYRELEHRIWR